MAIPKVLLVDDDEEFVVSLAKKLEKLNYSVAYVFSAQKALELLERESVDAAILDVKMPEIDGLTLLAKIKEKYKDIEAILLTGYASVTDGVEGMNRGAYDYLVKPASIDVLTARIDAAFGKKSAHDDLEKEKFGM